MKVLVITRHLPGSRPVPSAVIELPEQYSKNTITAIESNHKAAFIKKFPEFKEAAWHTDVMEVAKCA